MANLTMYRGDTRLLSLAITRDGEPEDLTDAALWFTAKESKDDDDDAAVFQKTSDDGIVIDADPTTGLAVVTIEPEDTAEMTDDGILYYDVQLKTAGGVVETIEAGRLTVARDVTRVTSL